MSGLCISYAYENYPWLRLSSGETPERFLLWPLPLWHFSALRSDSRRFCVRISFLILAHHPRGLNSKAAGPDLSWKKRKSPSMPQTHRFIKYWYIFLKRNFLCRRNLRTRVFVSKYNLLMAIWFNHFLINDNESKVIWDRIVHSISIRPF